MTKPKITGTGSYLPETKLSNQELSKFVDTSDEWIKQRVGIESRHIAEKHETTSFMATEAAKQAIIASGIDTAEIDLIIVATSTPDDKMPSVAVSVQQQLGIKTGAAFDVSAACSGFIYALSVAEGLFATGVATKALVIGSERMSRILDWSDRSTCVLFGDGAGAVVLEAKIDNETSGFLSTSIYSNGEHRDLLFVPNNLSEAPFETGSAECFLQMQGNRVFKHAVNTLGGLVKDILSKNNLQKSDIDWLVPHQANQRIINATAKKFALPAEKVVLTLKTHGNTTAASVALALDVAVRDGRIKSGDLLLLEAFGAGFTWGAALIRY